MQRTGVIKQLGDYLTRDVLDGKDVGLSETTPLLEWGIVNSLEIVRLLSFIQRQFQVNVPAEQLTAEHFMNLGAIADLVIASSAKE